jgi:hypothetical protein
MDKAKLKLLRILVPTTFDARIEEAVAARRTATSRPIFSKSAAVREAISEWLSRQAA